MPVIDHDLHLGIEPVDQISAPIIRTQHRPLHDFSPGNSLHRLAFASDRNAHPSTAANQRVRRSRDDKRYGQRENRPHVPSHPRFDDGHSLENPCRGLRLAADARARQSSPAESPKPEYFATHTAPRTRRTNSTSSPRSYAIRGRDVTSTAATMISSTRKHFCATHENWATETPRCDPSGSGSTDTNRYARCSFHPYGFTRLAANESSPTHAKSRDSLRRRDPLKRFFDAVSFRPKPVSIPCPDQKIPNRTKPTRNPPCTFTHTSISSGKQPQSFAMPSLPVEAVALRRSRIQNQASVNSQLTTCGRARKCIGDADIASNTSTSATQMFVPRAISKRNIQANTPAIITAVNHTTPFNPATASSSPTTTS